MHVSLGAVTQARERGSSGRLRLGSGVGAGPPSAGGFLLEASALSFEMTLVTSLFPE